MGDLTAKIKKYFRFSLDEVKSIALASLLIGFMFAFKDFTVSGLVYGIIVVALSLLFHIGVQKIMALYMGFEIDFKLWWYGLLIGLAITFVSNGKVWWLVLPGGITFSILARHRLGKFRYGLNYWPMGIVAFSGVIASVVFGTLFKNIELYILGTQMPFLHNIFIFNLVLAVCSMIPIPPLDGHYMFYASRMWFTFLFGTIFAYAIFTLVFEIYSWIWAIIIGFIIWLSYYIKIERTLW